MKKILAIVLTFVLCFGVLSLAFAAEDEAIATVPDGYTGIYTAEELDGIRNNLSGKYILMNDIDLSSYENWNPIGTSDAPFTGELDGNGFSILGMTIKKECTDGDKMYFALFASMRSGTVTDLKLLNVDIDAKFTGEVSSSFRAGALAGYASNCTIENCVVSGKISLDGFNEGDVGGLVGKENMCFPIYCVNYAEINIIAENIYDISVGGISGISTNDSIEQCCNYGDITANGTDSNDSFGELKIGGIVSECGIYTVQVFDCYNRGDIYLDFSTPSTYAGGIMGVGYAIECCYNTGKIDVPENFSGYIGGVSGDYFETGFAIVPAPGIENVYYINEGLYPSYLEKRPPTDDSFDNAKLLTADEMKQQESFVGFDFETVWEMEENGYPVLRNMPVIPEDEKDESSTTETTTESVTELTTVTTTQPTTIETTVTETATVTTVPITTEKATTDTSTTEVEITQSTTEPATEKPTTEPSTESTSAEESTTEPATDPNGSDDETCWLIKLLNKILDFFIWIFSVLCC